MLFGYFLALGSLKFEMSSEVLFGSLAAVLAIIRDLICIFVNLPSKPSLRDLVRYATLMPWMLAWVLSRVSFSRRVDALDAIFPRLWREDKRSYWIASYS